MISEEAESWTGVPVVVTCYRKVADGNRLLSTDASRTSLFESAEANRHATKLIHEPCFMKRARYR